MNASPLVPLGFITGGPETESKLHSRFSHCRRHGEWFEFNPDIASYIRDHVDPWPDPPKEFQDDPANIAREIIKVKAAGEKEEDIAAALALSPALMRTFMRLAMRISFGAPNRR